MIADDWREEMHKYVTGTAKGLGAVVIAVGGVADHVHLLARLKATHSVADFVRELKKATSTWAARRDPRFAWQVGYAALSVGRTESDMIARYIWNQQEHHRTVSSADELKSLLEEQGVEYDPRFFE